MVHSTDTRAKVSLLSPQNNKNLQGWILGSRKQVKNKIYGNQLMPQPLDSKEDEKMEDPKEEEKDPSEAMKPEELPQNSQREKIMKLPSLSL
nr:protein-L-isoaspartate O-methyltransferase domain-containing protein 1 [Oryctolagus cuniculus]